MGICAIFSSRKVHNIIKMEIGIMARIGPSHNIHTLEKLFHGKKKIGFMAGLILNYLTTSTHWQIYFMKKEIGFMAGPGLDGLCGIPVLPSH